MKKNHLEFLVNVYDSKVSYPSYAKNNQQMKKKDFFSKNWPSIIYTGTTSLSSLIVNI